MDTIDSFISLWIQFGWLTSSLLGHFELISSIFLILTCGYLLEMGCVVIVLCITKADVL